MIDLELITFNPFRTIGIKGINYIKAENMFAEELKIKSANWILFPEYWQVNALVYAWQKNIFPSISSYHLGHNKIEMTRYFKAVVPENTPETLILNSNYQNIAFIEASLSYPFIAKKIKSSEGKGIFLLKNKRELTEYIEQNDILYLQEYLPTNKDLRIVYLGNDVFTAYWRIGKEDDFRNNIALGGTISRDQIPEEALNLVKFVAKKANINHAGFDVICHQGKYYLLEFNVMFGNKGLNGMSKDISANIINYIQGQYRPDNFDQTKRKIII